MGLTDDICDVKDCDNYEYKQVADSIKTENGMTVFVTPSLCRKHYKKWMELPNRNAD